MIAPSILRQLKYSFLGFGLAMGLVFPLYANFFVNWKEGMLLWFCLGCIVAGITIGIINLKLLEWLLVRKLRKVAIFYRDYKTESGLTVPHVLETVVDGTPSAHKMTLEHVTVNPVLDDRLFAKPQPLLAQVSDK